MIKNKNKIITDLPIDSTCKTIGENYQAPSNLENEFANPLKNFEKDEIFIKLFPDPTTNLAFVYWGEANIHAIEIYNKEGILISDVPIQNTMEQYELTGLASGEYLIRLIMQNGSAILKKATFL